MSRKSKGMKLSDPTVEKENVLYPKKIDQQKQINRQTTTSLTKSSLALRSKKDKPDGAPVPSRKVLGELNAAQVQAREAFYSRQENQEEAQSQRVISRATPRRSNRSSVIMRSAIQASNVGVRNSAEREGDIVEEAIDDCENTPIKSVNRCSFRKAATTPSQSPLIIKRAAIVDGQKSLLKLHQSVTSSKLTKRELPPCSVVKSSLTSAGLLHFKLI